MKTRIAIIGLGMASAPHARSLLDLSDRVDVAAAYGPTAARRAKFASDHGLTVADDIDAVIADGSIDALIILTPPNTHLDLVRRAAEAGKHVLLEKPLEITTDRAKQLVSAMEGANCILAIVLQHRFRPVSIALADMMRDGKLGELVSASAKLSNWRAQSYYEEPGRGTKARDGGGVLLTQAIHTLDLMISIAGVPVEVSAYATTSPVHRMETEDLVMGAMKFANGAIGSVSATTAAYPGIPDAIEIIGTKGAACIEGTHLIARFHDGSEEVVTDNAQGTGAGSDPMAFSHQNHRAVLADFLDAIETGSEPRVSGREALKVHRLIDALLLSAETGQREAVLG